MFHRESGYFKTSYGADMGLYPLPIARWTVGVLVAAFLVLPLLTTALTGDRAAEYYVSIVNIIMIAVVGALGLNILVGYTGQISIGHAAFMSVGAYTAANLAVKLGLPFWVTLPAGGLMAAAIGVIVGIPSLRIKGLYLAIATLAAQLIIEWVINHVPWISGGSQASIEVPRPTFFGKELKTQRELYYFLLLFAVLAVVATLNLVRSRIGRAFIAIRDRDISAELLGIPLLRYKLMSFGLSAFYAGVAGGLWAYLFRVVTPESFPLVYSIFFLAAVIVGGMGTILGSILGAVFMTLVPEILKLIVGLVAPWFPNAVAILSPVRTIVFGLLIIGFLIFEPHGLAEIWRRIRRFFHLWPFRT